jgi:hypothetical protein
VEQGQTVYVLQKNTQKKASEFTTEKMWSFDRRDRRQSKADKWEKVKQNFWKVELQNGVIGKIDKNDVRTVSEPGFQIKLSNFPISMIIIILLGCSHGNT